ncbi:AAA family ATPase [Planotetraspora kaengkrachanensis]|uniref:Helicase n=1 Tax=Planotetraspora kaengkrachanensis TaxID=575193 RepID=A0A8J3PUV6_9ACTN|nr:AAA family ATPase [Planotetraspora kaengkrachanensis]GIG81396.1 helicase [Planotetraspora kaengkrachanensis]
MITTTPGQAAAEATEAILADFIGGPHRGVIVDSPPGAGKTTLVVTAATTLADASERLMIVAQTNEQVDDLTDKLATKVPTLSIGRLHSDGFSVPPRVTRHPGVTASNKIDQVEACTVVIATADKWAYVSDRTWTWAIVDEAYQMRSDKLLAIAALFDRALFVGDPGQLDPFSVVDTERWAGLAWDPMQSAVAVIGRLNDLPVHRLPVSWRLPASAAPLVSEAFYPFASFRSGTAAGDRELQLTTAGFPVPWDRTLNEAAATGWALHELPSRHTIRTDAEAVQACAGLATRLLQRGAVARDENGSHDVGPDRIAIGCAHNDQVAAIRAAGVPAGVTVDTANRLQGREYDVTIVLHPLSGRRDATAFHLESGRLCVLTSRHRQACIVVARAGIAELLDNHPSTGRVQLNVPVKFPDGWEANHAVLAHLSIHRVRA